MRPMLFLLVSALTVETLFMRPSYSIGLPGPNESYTTYFQSQVTSLTDQKVSDIQKNVAKLEQDIIAQNRNKKNSAKISLLEEQLRFYSKKLLSKDTHALL